MSRRECDVTSGLQEAYWSTLYRVDHRLRPFVLRFGKGPSWSRGTAGLGDSWAIITAFNPESCRLNGRENLARNRELHDMLWSLRLPAFRTVNSDARGEWREPGFLVVGMSRAVALELANTFEQNAVVCAEGGKVGLMFRSGEWLVRPDRVFSVRRLPPRRLPATAR